MYENFVFFVQLISMRGVFVGLMGLSAMIIVFLLVSIFRKNFVKKQFTDLLWGGFYLFLVVVSMYTSIYLGLFVCFIVLPGIVFVAFIYEKLSELVSGKQTDSAQLKKQPRRVAPAQKP